MTNKSPAPAPDSPEGEQVPKWRDGRCLKHDRTLDYDHQRLMDYCIDCFSESVTGRPVIPDAPAVEPSRVEERMEWRQKMTDILNDGRNRLTEDDASDCLDWFLHHETKIQRLEGELEAAEQHTKIVNERHYPAPEEPDRVEEIRKRYESDVRIAEEGAKNGNSSNYLGPSDVAIGDLLSKITALGEQVEELDEMLTLEAAHSKKLQARCANTERVVETAIEWDVWKREHAAETHDYHAEKQEQKLSNAVGDYISALAGTEEVENEEI